jgi:hypothetical protein
MCLSIFQEEGRSFEGRREHGKKRDLQQKVMKLQEEVLQA